MPGQCCYHEPEFLVASRRQAALTLDIGANPVKHDTGRLISLLLPIKKQQQLDTCLYVYRVQPSKSHVKTTQTACQDNVVIMNQSFW